MDLEKRVRQIIANIPDIVKFGKDLKCNDQNIKSAIINYTTIMLNYDNKLSDNIYFGVVPFSFNFSDGSIIPF